MSHSCTCIGLGVKEASVKPVYCLSAWEESNTLGLQDVMQQFWIIHWDTRLQCREAAGEKSSGSTTASGQGKHLYPCTWMVLNSYHAAHVISSQVFLSVFG